jgi:hypothetical protein
LPPPPHTIFDSVNKYKKIPPGAFTRRSGSDSDRRRTGNGPPPPRWFNRTVPTCNRVQHISQAVNSSSPTFSPCPFEKNWSDLKVNPNRSESCHLKGPYEGACAGTFARICGTTLGANCHALACFFRKFPSQSLPRYY